MIKGISLKTLLLKSNKDTSIKPIDSLFFPSTLISTFEPENFGLDI
jgi:hypothetical protein